MATSIAGISFDLSFDGSKMLASINDSCKKVKDRFNQSFSQAAKKSTEAIKTGNTEIDKILSQTARSAKSKAAAIASVYKKEGESASEAFRKAWLLIERDSKSGSGEVKKHIKGIGSQFKKTSSEIEDDASSLKTRVSGIGTLTRKLGSLLVGAFAVKKLTDFGKSCLELGSDLAEVQNVVDVTFPNMTTQVDKFAKSAAQSFGLSETMAKQFTGTFGAMAKAFGFSEEQAYNMGSSLTKLAGDVASFYNLSQDEAYTKLKSVFTGETESLKDLGVVMTQTALDSYALANGFGKTTAKMSEAEKVALRYSFVQNQLAAAQGDFARTSGSWANQVRILTLQFDSLKATIGQGLINIFTPVIRVINTVIGKLITLANAFKSFTELITGQKSSNSASGQISAIGSAAAGASAGMDDAASSADNLSSANNGVAKSAQKPVKLIFTIRSIDDEKRKEEKLIYTSNTDQLTGCFNRRAYEKDIAEMDLNTEFIYLSMDLDELLKGASYCMKKCFDDYGKVYRIGGDEFIVILFTNYESFAKIKEAFDNTVANWSGELVSSITVSCGIVSGSEQPWASWEEISRIADRRMYEQKAIYYRKNGIDRYSHPTG